MTRNLQQKNANLTANTLFDEVYDRLKAMAGRQRHRGGAPLTLGTTELVHELYLRMGQNGEKQFNDPAQFFAYAARAMRHILIDAASSRLQLKAGGDQQRIAMSDPLVGNVEVDPMLALQLDAGLRALEQEDPRAAQVVELHYFAGLAMDQVADSLGIARRTVDRDWQYAKAFLALHSDNN
jgi:RNA polymerase sigma factor (TIGR02999 family)